MLKHTDPDAEAIAALAVGAPATSERFRMERSVVSKDNFDLLKNISKDRIPETLLEYICYEHQYNVFGYGVLDPEQFARRFHFDTRYLREVHEDPYQIRVRGVCPEKENRRRRLPAKNSPKTAAGALSPFVEEEGKGQGMSCFTRLENALYVLANFPLDVTTTEVLDDRSLVRKYMSLRVLKSFSYIQDAVTGKVCYTYELEPDFRRNLSSLYLSVDINSLVRLRRSGLGALYLFLVKVRDAVFHEGKSCTEPGKPAFDYLCRLADLPDYAGNMKYRKRDLKARLKKIADNTELRFTVDWLPDDSGEKYAPILYFLPELGQTVGGPDSGLEKSRRDNERMLVACSEFKHNLAQACGYKKSPHTPEAEDFFFEWIKRDDEEAIGLMRTALAKTFINLSYLVPEDLPKRIEHFCWHAARERREDFDKWLPEIFNGNYGFSFPRARKIDIGDVVR